MMKVLVDVLYKKSVDIAAWMIRIWSFQILRCYEKLK